MSLTARPKVKWGSTKELPEECYNLLAEMYGWTYEQIVSHNRFQLVNAIKGYQSKIKTFKSMEDYQRWLTTR